MDLRSCALKPNEQSRTIRESLACFTASSSSHSIGALKAWTSLPLPPQSEGTCSGGDVWQMSCLWLHVWLVLQQSGLSVLWEPVCLLEGQRLRSFAKGFVLFGNSSNIPSVFYRNWTMYLLPGDFSQLFISCWRKTLALHKFPPNECKYFLSSLYKYNLTHSNWDSLFFWDHLG